VTASGGPFRERRDLATVTKQEALRHPTWSMGPKITIDSATMMNKGLELIEAHFLFGLAYDRIEVVVHKESIVHGIVRLVDGTLLMQAAATDMRIPIQAALLHPQRLQSPAPSVDLTEVESLHFEPLDVERFPLVALAYEAGRRASGFPAVLNAANEEAVRAFLGDRVSFTDIYRIVETTMSAHRPASIDGLEELLEIDGWARDHARGVIESGPRRGPRRLVGSRGGRS
jgi:1-deoxy-D-xylulose-5-phosphate reductoisomerase